RDVQRAQEAVRDQGRPRAAAGSETAGGGRGEDVRRAELLRRREMCAVVQFVRRNPMVFSVAWQEDDRDRAALTHSRRIAWRAVRRDEELRLFVLEFKRIAEGRASDDPDDGRRHSERTSSPGAMEVTS